MKNTTYPLIVHPDGPSGFTVTVPELPGLVTDGSTMEEALAKADEAIALYLGLLTADARHSVPARRRAGGGSDGAGGDRWPCPFSTPSLFRPTGTTYLPQRRRAAPPEVTTEAQAMLPLIGDLRVLIQPDDDGGFAPELWSARAGLLVHVFPWPGVLAEQLQSSPDGLLRIGDVDDPLIEVGQGQELFIWRQGGEVLVIAGDLDADPGSFSVAVRVDEESFIAEWQIFWALARGFRAPGESRAPGRRAAAVADETATEATSAAAR